MLAYRSFARLVYQCQMMKLRKRLVKHLMWKRVYRLLHYAYKKIRDFVSSKKARGFSDKISLIFVHRSRLAIAMSRWKIFRDKSRNERRHFAYAIYKLHKLSLREGFNIWSSKIREWNRSESVLKTFFQVHLKRKYMTILRQAIDTWRNQNFEKRLKTKYILGFYTKFDLRKTRHLAQLWFTSLKIFCQRKLDLYQTVQQKMQRYFVKRKFLQLRKQTVKSRASRMLIAKSMYKHYHSRLRSGFRKWLLFTHNIRYNELEDNITTRELGAKQLVLNLYIKNKYRLLTNYAFQTWSKFALLTKSKSLEENIQVQILQAEQRGWEEARVAIEKHFAMPKIDLDIMNVHSNSK